MTSTSPDTIERILSLTPHVHIYNIPPLTSNKGHNAASWTADPARQIFTARLRVLESATPTTPPTSANPSPPETITIKVLLEDPSTGDLFAECPYTSPAVVEAAQDSSRFFAVRVVGEGGMKATLGLGFEDRSEAVDFGICLQEARKVLGFEEGGKKGKGGEKMVEKEREKRDWSLKEGETIRVDVGGRRGRRSADGDGGGGGGGGDGGVGSDAKAALFSIKPPPPPPAYSASDSSLGGAIPMLAPPPSAGEARAERRRSREIVVPKKSEAEAAGFDDGEFGEFQ